MIDIMSRLKSLAVGVAAEVETADVATEFATGIWHRCGSWDGCLGQHGAKHYDGACVAKDAVLICGTQNLLFLGGVA